MSNEKITKTERTILANQNRILALLNTEQSINYNILAEIAESGYVGLYYRLFENIDNEVSQEICNETHDILTMYRNINNAIAKLSQPDKDSLDLESIAFEGFDANNDPHFGFMEFLIEKQGKYSELREICRNSHSSGSIFKYRRLLEIDKRKKAEGQTYLTFDTLREMMNLSI